MCCCLQIQNTKTTKFHSFNIWHFVFVLFSIKHWVSTFCKSSRSVSVRVSRGAPTFLESGLCLSHCHNFTLSLSHSHFPTSHISALTPDPLPSGLQTHHSHHPFPHLGLFSSHLYFYPICSHYLCCMCSEFDHLLFPYSLVCLFVNCLHGWWPLSASPFCFSRNKSVSVSMWLQAQLPRTWAEK